MKKYDLILGLVLTLSVVTGCASRQDGPGINITEQSSVHSEPPIPNINDGDFKMANSVLFGLPFSIWLADGMFGVPAFGVFTWAMSHQGP